MYSSFNARALGLKLSADETLRLASSCGFEGVDVMVRDAIEEGDDLAILRRKMDDLGLRGGAFPLPFDWRGDEPSFEAGLRDLPRHADAAAGLGIVRTGTWVLPETPERPSGHEAFDAHQAAVGGFHAKRLGAIAAVLGRSGIRLGLEVIGVESSRTGRGWPFLHRLDRLERLRDHIERLWETPIGVVADSWHLYAADEPISHALDFGVQRIVWVHVADLPAGALPDRSLMVDSVRGLPGDHQRGLSRPLLSALRARGYDGPVTAEPLGRCPSLLGLSPESAARVTAEAMRSVWPA